MSPRRAAGHHAVPCKETEMVAPSASSKNCAKPPPHAMSSKPSTYGRADIRIRGFRAREPAPGNSAPRHTSAIWAPTRRICRGFRTCSPSIRTPGDGATAGDGAGSRVRRRGGGSGRASGIRARPGRLGGQFCGSCGRALWAARTSASATPQSVCSATAPWRSSRRCRRRPASTWRTGRWLPTSPPWRSPCPSPPTPWRGAGCVPASKPSWSGRAAWRLRGAAAARLGAEVTGVDPDAGRLEVAAALGAHSTVAAQHRTPLVDLLADAAPTVVFECTGVPAMVQEATDPCAPAQGVVVGLQEAVLRGGLCCWRCARKN